MQRLEMFVIHFFLESVKKEDNSLQQDITSNQTNVKQIFIFVKKQLNFEERTSMLGVKVMCTRSKETFTIEKFAKGYWNIEIEYKASLDINDQLIKIINPIFDKSDKINKICNKFNAKCGFVIGVTVENGEFPAMYFKTDFIEFAASIGAEIGFDPYFYSDCE